MQTQARKSTLNSMLQTFNNLPLQKKAFMAFLVLLAVASSAMLVAFTAPAAGSFAYDFYDLIVVKVLQGAIGFILGIGGVVWSATQLQKSPAMAIIGLVFSTAILKAEAITTSLGFIVM